MRSFLVSLATAASSVAVPAMALPGIEALPGVIGQMVGSRACSLRIYDAAHLAANPNQRTTSLHISFRRERWQDVPPEVSSQNRIRIEVTRRGVREPLPAISKDDSDEESRAEPVMLARDDDQMVRMQEFLPMCGDRQRMSARQMTWIRVVEHDERWRNT